MISVVESYFEALNRIDREAYLACFTEDAIVMDPYGGRPFEGQQGLNKFMDGMERTWAGSISPSSRASIIASNFSTSASPSGSRDSKSTRNIFCGWRC